MRTKQRKTYCADFETTSVEQYKLEGRTRVYLWKMLSLDYKEDYIGISMDSFFERLYSFNENSIIYFHNLSFDGEFIMWYLVEHNWIYTDELTKDKEFNTTIDETSSIFTIKVHTDKCEIEFRCSYKLFPKSIKEVGKLVGIEKLNETHNYDEIKNYNSVDELTEEEIMYISNDVKIMVELIKYLQKKGVKGITMSSSAFKDWKKQKYNICKYQMTKNPNEEIVEIVRKSYRGGITKVNPKYAGVEFDSAISFDVNSLYPSVMYDGLMPIGDGKIYNSVEDARKDGRKLYIIVAFVPYAKVRTGKHAFIGNQSGFSYSRKYEYDEELYNQYLYLWYDEFELFKLIYDAEIIIQKVVGFKGVRYLFKDYIDKWYHIKETTTNPVERSLAKLMLNSLYGKFGMNDNRVSKEPVGYNEDGIIYKVVDNCSIYYYKEVASYITSKARVKYATFMNMCGDLYIYGDTDSLYIKGSEIPEVFNGLIDQKKLGYWKYEGHYTRFKALKAKCYIKQLDDGTIERKIAGCPKEASELINFDNFGFGLTLKGVKNVKRKVYGGIIIDKTDFTIKG